MAKRLPNFRRMGLGTIEGFGKVPAEYVMPHFDNSGPFKFLVDLLRRGMKDGERMLGIDENTALVGRPGGEWKVMGKSKVHLLTRKDAQIFAAGGSVPLPQ
ncbi:MAG: hypothetical protein HY258_05675 [Chloroflexi bacterium]|nr:hypothetical protein [Chloroflexota bacterium]